MSQARSESEEEGLGAQWEEIHPLSSGCQCSGVSGQSEIGAVGNARSDWDIDWDGWARTALVE